MLIGLTAVLGAVGWALWYLARQDAGNARQEAQDATSRARLAEARSAADSAAAASAMATAGAAEAQSRVANTENRSLRRALADARAAAARPSGPTPDPDLFDSTTGRLRVYRARGTGDE